MPKVGIIFKFQTSGAHFIERVGLKKNQTTPRPSEHPPVMGEKMSKRLGGIKRLQIQNLFMAFKQVLHRRVGRRDSYWFVFKNRNTS